MGVVRVSGFALELHIGLGSRSGLGVLVGVGLVRPVSRCRVRVRVGARGGVLLPGFGLGLELGLENASGVCVWGVYKQSTTASGKVARESGASRRECAMCTPVHRVGAQHPCWCCVCFWMAGPPPLPSVRLDWPIFRIADCFACEVASACVAIAGRAAASHHAKRMCNGNLP